MTFKLYCMRQPVVSVLLDSWPDWKDSVHPDHKKGVAFTFLVTPPNSTFPKPSEKLKCMAHVESTFAGGESFKKAEAGALPSHHEDPRSTE